MFNPVQPLKATKPISLIDEGIYISVNLVYPEKAPLSILIAVLGSVILVAELHPTPTILVTPSSYITLSIPVQPAKVGLFPNIYYKIRIFYFYPF